MRISSKGLPVVLSLAILYLVCASPAFAHLMVAQHGTINIIDDDAYMVLSLPVSAFAGIDDDEDGKVTMIEFNNHRLAIVASIKENVTLSSLERRLRLKEIILSPVVEHDNSAESVSQLIVMGRFYLAGMDSALRFEVGLYGSSDATKNLEISATRVRDHQKDIFELTPAAPASLLFASSL
ncbi:Uncharacterised protein [Halioglobus japonicus]|nr:Uncharacterised protein [Halioglobus japonicus]